MVESVPFHQQGAEGLEQGQIPVDPDGQVEIGQIRAGPDPAARLLRVLEPRQARFAQRIDGQDLGPAPLGLLQRRQHPGMVGAGILPGQHQQLSRVHVLEDDAGLADPDRLGERDAGGLVAHVGAVRQVVRAVGPHEQLVDERSLVGGPARRVKDCLVRIVQGTQLGGDHLEGVVPADLLVVGGSGPLDHRVSDSALLPQPVLGLRVQFGDAVPGEEVRRGPHGGRFLGHRLRAVLAEFGRVPVTHLGIRPGATHAVETLGLIQLQQRRRRPPRPHPLHRPLEADGYRGRPRRMVLGRPDPYAVIVCALLPRHPPILRPVTSSCECRCLRRGRLLHDPSPLAASVG